MSRKRFFDEAELLARGWRRCRCRWFLGKPAKAIPGRGDVYAVVDVEFAEAPPGWREQMRLEFEEDAERERHYAANRARQKALNAERTALYRLFDAAGTLLYIGITTDPKDRFRGHRTGNAREEPKEWWPEVAHGKTLIEWFGSRPEAEAAETFAIVTERPRYNKAKASEEFGRWFGRWFRRSWLWERLQAGHAGSGLSGPQRAGLVRKIDRHEVPFERWWKPHRPCNRLMAEREATAVRIGMEIGDGVQEVLLADALVRLTRHHRGECERCRQPYPCAVVRSVAVRFSDDPQYLPLWGPHS